MMSAQPTVTISRVEGHDALRLGWGRWVAEDDVHPAFHRLTELLDEAASPLHVIVDLSEDPQLPLAATIYETLMGPFMHPRMGQWLVVGTNQRAQIIARAIVHAGHRATIHWFDSEKEALAFLDLLEKEAAPTQVPAFEGLTAGQSTQA